MSDGAIRIDIELDDSQVRSDVHVIEQLLRGLGNNAGDSMQNAFNHSSQQVRHDAAQTASEVQQQLSNPIHMHINLNGDTTINQASRVFDSVNRHATETEGRLNSLKTVFEGTFLANAAERGIEAVTEGVKTLIEKGVEYNATQDKMLAVWGVLTGSAAKGKEMVDMVNNFQRATGYATETLNEMEQKIYHIKGSAEETKEMTKTFTTLGDAMGLSDEKLLSVSEQFAQMMANGKAYAGDLNIMTNAFPAFGDALVEHMHMGMDKIRKLASEGKLPAKVVEDTLMDMQKKYAGATEAVMGTTQGLWRVMQSNFDRLAGSFAKPLFDMKKSGFKDLADWIQSNQSAEFFHGMGQKLADVVGKVTDFVSYLNAHRDTVFAFAKVVGVMVGEILAVKAISAIVGTIGETVGALARLTGAYRTTGAAATTMTAEAVAGAERTAIATNTATAGAGRGLMAFHGILGLVGTGLIAFGGKWGMIAGVAINFVPQILKAGGAILNFAKGIAGATTLLELATGPVGWIILGITAVGTAAVLAYKNIKPFRDWCNNTGSEIKNGVVKGIEALQSAFKPLFNTTVDWGDKIPKATKKALDGYLKLSDDATRAMKTLEINSTKITDSIAKDMDTKYQKMADNVIGHFKDINNKAGKELDWLKGTNKAEYDAIMKEVTTSNNKKIKDTQKTADQIKAIVDKAGKEHRTLTLDEQIQVNKLQDKMNKSAVDSMSHSQQEQEIILGKLKDHTSKLSADQAAAIVKNAKKQEDETIKSADNTYKETVKSANKKYKESTDWADQEYYVNHAISFSQYQDLVKHAGQTRDESIAAAKDKRDKTVATAQDEFSLTVDYAQQQAKGHIDQINWETGEVYSAWDTLKQNTFNTVNAILGFFGLPKMSDPSMASAAKATQLERNQSFYGLHGGGGHNVSAFANGTDNFHEGGLALVGDGTGSNAGSEAIITPDGKLHFSPAKPTLMNLPSGTQVIPASITKQLFDNVPRYANGVGDIASKIGSWIGNGADYIFSHTAKAFGVDGIGSSLARFGSTLGSVGNGAFDHILKWGTDWVQKKMDSWFSMGSGSAPSGKVSGNLVQWLTQAMGITNTPMAYLGALEQIAMHESGGDPHAQNNWDSNARAGHPSKGLMQTIDGTFNSYAMSGLGDIWNPVANAVAAIRYMIARYGGIGNVPGVRAVASGHGYVGYANGTTGSVGGNVVVGENEPELIQTTDGRLVVANRATSFHDFMAGSTVTPLSKITQHANGVLAKAKSVLNSVGNPSLNTPLVKASIANGKDTTVQVNIQPVVVQAVLDGKVISQTVTDIQNQNSVRTSRLRGQV